MTLTIIAATTAILMLGLAVLFLVCRLGSNNQVLPVTTDWLSELSTDRYRPMMRLLDESDFQFLRTRTGFTPEMANRLRRQRVHAFRGYLQMLEEDFNRVSMALRLTLARSAYDRPELAALLFQRRLLFAFALFCTECRIGLFRLGLTGVDVSVLIQ